MKFTIGSWIQAVWDLVFTFVCLVAIFSAVAVGTYAGCRWAAVHTEVRTQALNLSSTSVLDAVNSLRKSNGLEPFTLDYCLADAAKFKARHMEEHHYWGHNYTDPETGDEQNAAFTYSMQKCTKGTVAEVLAASYITSDDVVQNWMGSKEHRELIMSENLHHAGVSVIVRRFHGEMQTLVVMEMSKK